MARHGEREPGPSAAFVSKKKRIRDSCYALFRAHRPKASLLKAMAPLVGLFKVVRLIEAGEGLGASGPSSGPQRRQSVAQSVGLSAVKVPVDAWHFIPPLGAILRGLRVEDRATKGCFNVTSTRVFSDLWYQKKHSPYENLRRDDHPSKNEPKRVETGRDMSLQS